MFTVTDKIAGRYLGDAHTFEDALTGAARFNVEDWHCTVIWSPDGQRIAEIHGDGRAWVSGQLDWQERFYTWKRSH